MGQQRIKWLDSITDTMDKNHTNTYTVIFIKVHNYIEVSILVSLHQVFTRQETWKGLLSLPGHYTL